MIHDALIIDRLSSAIGTDASPLFDVINQRGVIYGGFILHCLGIAPTSDIDVACNSKEDMQAILNAAVITSPFVELGHIANYFNGAVHVTTQCAIFPTGFKMDLTYVLYKDLHDFVEGLDMDYISAAYHQSKFARVEGYGEVLINRQCRHGRFTCHARIAKALSKGFQVGPIQPRPCVIKPPIITLGLANFAIVEPIQSAKEWYSISEWPEIASWN